MRKIVILMGVLAAVATCRAGIISFDGLAGTDMPGSYTAANGRTQFLASANPTATIDGYNFTGSFNVLVLSEEYYEDNSNAEKYPHNGTDYISSYLYNGHSLTIERADGELFDFFSADITSTIGSPASTFSFLASFDNGQTVEQLITLDSISNIDDTDGNDFENFLFDFRDIASLTITGVTNYYEIALDNIEVSGVPETSAIPEPSVYAFAFLCLIGAVVYRKRSFCI